MPGSSPDSKYQCVSRPGTCKFEWCCGPECACGFKGKSGTKQEHKDIAEAERRQYRWRVREGIWPEDKMTSQEKLTAELESLRKSFHHGTDVSLAIVTIEERLWELHGKNAVPVNGYGEEEDAQIVLLAELAIILADFKDWTGGFSPKEAEDQIEIYIEINWQGWSEEAKAWIRKAQV